MVAVEADVPGLWRIKITGNKAFCGISVRGQSDFEVYVAFTWDMSTDNGLHSNDGEAYPVAHGEGFIIPE